MPHPQTWLDPGYLGPLPLLNIWVSHCFLLLPLLPGWVLDAWILPSSRCLDPLLPPCLIMSWTPGSPLPKCLGPFSQMSRSPVFVPLLSKCRDT